MNKAANIFIAILIIITATTFTSCKKYEEGPSFSILSKKARLVNTWQLEKWFLNGIDQTSLLMMSVSVIYLEITKNGNYTNTIIEKDGTVNSENGTWTWADKKASVILSPASSADPPYEIKILKLMNNELNFETILSNETQKFHYVTKK